MNFKNLLYLLAIVGLFVFGMMSFLIVSQSDNEVSDSLLNDYRINETYGDLNNSLRSSQSNAQTSYGNFSKTPPTQEYGELQVTSVLSVTNTAKALTVGLWTILIKLPLTTIGLPDVVANIIGALLLISLAIGLWLLWKGVTS